VGNDSHNSDATMLSKASLLWSEYEHRHSHCWAMIFQLTAAVVFLSSVPYLDQSATQILGPWIMLAPALSVALAGAGVLVMHRELNAFSQVKTAFRSLQATMSLIKHPEKSRFKAYVLSYVYCLVVCATGSFFVSWFIWLPQL
jgi:hypothetical protein